MFSAQNQGLSPANRFETAILSHIREQFPTKGVLQGKIKGDMRLSEARFYAKGLQALSDHFNGIEILPARNYLTIKPYRAAYLLYFFPANWVKIQAILAEIQAYLPQKTHYHICDVGSGAGPLALGAAMDLARRGKGTHFSLTLMDQSAAILGDATQLGKKLLTEQGVSIQMNTVTGAVSPRRLSLGQSRYDLILLGDFLNEIDEDQQFDVLHTVLDRHLAPEGRVILLEPALQVTARALQRLRDRVLGQIPGTRALAPCLRQGVCPLNFYNKRDWCHFYSDWQRPSWFPLLEKEAGLHKDWLKYAYLVLGREERAGPSTSLRAGKGGRGGSELSLWRVISNPMRSKGKQELVLCGPQGRIHLTAQYKHKSLKNKDFFEMQRGDKVEIDPNGWHELRSGKESWDYRLSVRPESDFRKL